MPDARVSALFRDATTGEELEQLNFGFLPTLPRVGELVVLSAGERGQVQVVEWHLAQSRLTGATARVELYLALDVTSSDR